MSLFYLFNKRLSGSNVFNPFNGLCLLLLQQIQPVGNYNLLLALTAIILYALCIHFLRLVEKAVSSVSRSQWQESNLSHPQSYVQWHLPISTTIPDAYSAVYDMLWRSEHLNKHPSWHWIWCWSQGGGDQSFWLCVDQFGIAVAYCDCTCLFLWWWCC